MGREILIEFPPTSVKDGLHPHFRLLGEGASGPPYDYIYTVVGFYLNLQQCTRKAHS
jgi:hypothetical protein